MAKSTAPKEQETTVESLELKAEEQRLEGTEAATLQGQRTEINTADTNTINTANGAGNKISEAEMKRDVEAAARVLKSKGTKSVTIPKQMAPILGETVISCINGACIRVPVDGESYDVPEPYHKIIMDSLKTIHAGDVRDERGFGDKVNDEALS